MTAILGLTACQKQEIETRTDDMPAANVPESDPEGSAEDAYKEYACYTEEMENMVDEICEKYGLSKLSNCHLDISYSDICSKTGVGELCLDSENVKNDILCGYLYDDGSFLFEGNITMRGSKVYDAGYQFARSVKGTFNTSYLNLGDFTERNVRKYTTKKRGRCIFSVSCGHQSIHNRRAGKFVYRNQRTGRFTGCCRRE